MSDFIHYSGEGPNPPPGILPKYKVGDFVRYDNQIWQVFGIRWRSPGDFDEDADGYFRYDIRKHKGRDNVSEDVLEPVELSSWEKETL
jgi:hypothetical protein